jgi:hypothetical protein
MREKLPFAYSANPLERTFEKTYHLRKTALADFRILCRFAQERNLPLTHVSDMFGRDESHFLTVDDMVIIGEYVDERYRISIIPKTDTISAIQIEELAILLTKSGEV